MDSWEVGDHLWHKHRGFVRVTGRSDSLISSRHPISVIQVSGKLSGQYFNTNDEYCTKLNSKLELFNILYAKED